MGSVGEWTGDFGLNPDSNADAVGDTDGADFLAWQRNLTASALATSQAVPEPTSAMLLALGVVVSRGAKVSRAE